MVKVLVVVEVELVVVKVESVPPRGSGWPARAVKIGSV